MDDMTALQSVNGVGRATAHRLLETFGNVENVVGADIDALCAVKGISHTRASALQQALHADTVTLQTDTPQGTKTRPVPTMTFDAAADPDPNPDGVDLTAANWTDVLTDGRPAIVAAAATVVGAAVGLLWRWRR